MSFIEDEQLAEVLSYCSQSTRVLAKTLFPGLFWTDFSVLHDQIFKIIDSPSQRKVIAAPRGLGKTTIARTLAANAILFRKFNFICYVMNSATSAEMQTENLKYELLSNKIVKRYFGNIKNDIEYMADYDESFSKKTWAAFGEVLVLPRGSGQQIRGLNWHSHRPGLIIVDDLEKKDELRSKDNRDNVKSWFHSDLMKSVDRYSNKWVVVYIDTLKHEDSLLQELLDAPEWEGVHLALCDENFNSNVPEYMTTEEIKKELEQHREKGKLDEFYSEYMNIPNSLEDASFKAKDFNQYLESDPEFLGRVKHLENIIIVDPAKTTKIQSADSAIVVIGIDQDKSRYYIRDVFSGKVYPDQLYEEIFSRVQRYNVNTVGIEVTSLHEFIVQPMKNEMFSRGIAPELVELKAIGSKEERIKSVVQYYRRGYMYHNSAACVKLEKQLLSFPKSKLWDCMDCVGYLPKMLEMGMRYFTGPVNSNEDEYDPEDQYIELEKLYEPALDDWRIV